MRNEMNRLLHRSCMKPRQETPSTAPRKQSQTKNSCRGVRCDSSGGFAVSQLIDCYNYHCPMKVPDVGEYLMHHAGCTCTHAECTCRLAAQTDPTSLLVLYPRGVQPADDAGPSRERSYEILPCPTTSIWTPMREELCVV